MSDRKKKDGEAAPSSDRTDPLVEPSAAEGGFVFVDPQQLGKINQYIYYPTELPSNISFNSGSSFLNRYESILSQPLDLGSTFLLPGTNERELSTEIEKLKQQLAEQVNKAVDAKKATGKAEKELSALRETVEELQQKERLTFILNRVHADARALLLASAQFRNAFLQSPTCSAFIMSVDIRRSTELMLKARKPELFAQFITGLCSNLRDVILSHHGVFDKFTGDGILAFFPDFYSGHDAGYYAVAAADACHRIFHEHYNASRHCFTSVLRDVGLGIGIDYGTTHLVQVGDGLTVVGTPVVYACRMGSGPAGLTLLNQPAYEQMFEHFSGLCTFHETSLDTKHEGRHVAYSITLNGKAYEPHPAGWRGFTPDEPPV